MSSNFTGIIVLGIASSAIFVPLMWDLYRNKQKKRREQQREREYLKTRKEQIALENIVSELRINQGRVSRTKSYMADIRHDLCEYEVDIRREIEQEKDEYKKIRLKGLISNLRWTERKVSELEESLNELTCLLCKCTCEITRNAAQ